MVVYETALLGHYALTSPLSIAPLGHQGVNNATCLVHSDSQTFVWKRYATFSDSTVLDYEHRLILWLAHQHLPFGVPQPVAARNGETLTHDGEQWQALFHLLPGTEPDRTSSVVTEAVGAGLATLHTALMPYSLDQRSGMGNYRNLASIHPRIPDPWSLTSSELGLPDEPSTRDLLAWWRDDLRRMRPVVERIYSTLPIQVIHGDFALGNTLFENDQLTAILDFEFAGPDARVLDIAAALRSVLQDQNEDKDFYLAEAFCRGYGSVARLTQQEIAALPTMMYQREAVSTVWWLGRDLTARNLQGPVERIASFRVMSNWIAHYGEQLVTTVAPLLA